MHNLMSKPTREENKAFRETFSMDIYRFWDWSGFDVIKFDEVIKTPDGISCSDFVRSQYGDDAVTLLNRLIKRS